MAPTAIPAVAPVESPDLDGAAGTGVGGGVAGVELVVVVLGVKGPELGSPATLVSSTVFVYPCTAAHPRPTDPPS